MKKFGTYIIKLAPYVESNNQILKIYLYQSFIFQIILDVILKDKISKYFSREFT